MFSQIGSLAVRLRFAALAAAIVVIVLGLGYGSGVTGDLVAGGFDDPASDSVEVQERLLEELGLGEADVVAGREHANVFHRRQAFNAVAIQKGLVGEDDRGVGGPLSNEVGRGAIVNLAVAKGLQFVPTQVAGVQGVAVEHDNFLCFHLRRH